MATNVEKVLRYRVIDDETKQLMAGFASEELAYWFAERMKVRTFREYKVVDSRG